mmetsp:Transcript_5903/g.12831  ORF Transcript_5903/g.12831 Transcript_5903/m.12831 type:complete len:221 (+) Transcript_5903:187-849(+)
MSVKICSHPGAGCIKAMPLTTNANNGMCSSYDQYNVHQITKAATELEIMRLREQSNKIPESQRHQRFPPVCQQILRSLPGNRKCIDCDEHNPDWASVSHGALLCLSCAGKHRGLGVRTSKVRSISMDSWNHNEVLSMLEGGNGQLSAFYARHGLCKDSYLGDSTVNSTATEAINLMRYKTKAALFYRKNLDLHVDRVCSLGVYKGREMSRKILLKVGGAS